MNPLICGIRKAYQQSVARPADSLRIFDKSECASFTLVDLWLFSLYRYQRSDGEKSHTILGLINVSTDDGELTEEKISHSMNHNQVKQNESAPLRRNFPSPP